MHDRIPGQSAHDQDDRLPDDTAGLSDELAAVLAAARRRAVRDGDRQTDTAHLLHTLLESDPEVRAAVGGGPRIARLLGYLVQRSIGYGLRWQSTVEDSGALPVVTRTDAATKTDAATRTDAVTNADATVSARAAAAGAAAPDRRSPLASAALEHARERAARRGGGPARGVDLLAGLLLDPESRAVEVLARAGIDAREAAARLDNDAEDLPAGHAEDARTAC
ncbi:Clp protease N-terminal domain-containing protein [Streptomyces sennicomposti]|uniref:Clp protease N-terminal domain-containing protein n=1 Tax=Streptomyces sennicomposti TaxID=2873384 RepID=UPI001CA718A7|nr:Clp protease N-terminal domain-containing protein [Streptomyces sennicomposti]MBY8864943.1 peptidase [Streptomyces sennicomposti]